MTVCPHCNATHVTRELVRHERDEVLTVHCPDCNAVIGRYRDP